MAKANSSELIVSDGKDMRVVDKDELALKVRQFRVVRGMTQQALGEQCGVSRFTIMRIENAQDITWESAYKVFAKLLAAGL